MTIYVFFCFSYKKNEVADSLKAGYSRLRTLFNIFGLSSAMWIERLSFVFLFLFGLNLAYFGTAECGIPCQIIYKLRNFKKFTIQVVYILNSVANKSPQSFTHQAITLKVKTSFAILIQPVKDDRSFSIVAVAINVVKVYW